MTSMTASLSDARAGPPPTPATQPTNVTTARPAAAPQPAASAARTTANPAATTKPVTVDMPEISGGKLHLSVDHETGRVVGRVVDRDSGKLLWQVPSDDMLRLIAATKEFLGPLYSTEA